MTLNGFLFVKTCIELLKKKNTVDTLKNVVRLLEKCSETTGKMWQTTQQTWQNNSADIAS